MIDINKKVNIAIHVMLMWLLVFISSLLIDCEFLIGWVTGKIYAIPIVVFILPFVSITWSSLTMFVLTRRERYKLNTLIVKYMNVSLIASIMLAIVLHSYELSGELKDLGILLILITSTVTGIMVGASLNQYNSPKSKVSIILMFYVITTVNYLLFYTLFYSLLSAYISYDYLFTTIAISATIHVCIEFVMLPAFQVIGTKKGS